MMSLFVKHGADINRINGFKEQALMHAAWTGHLPAVSWLLDRGASVDGDRTNGAPCITPLLQDTISLPSFSSRKALTSTRDRTMARHR